MKCPNNPDKTPRTLSHVMGWGIHKTVDTLDIGHFHTFFYLFVPDSKNPHYTKI